MNSHAEDSKGTEKPKSGSDSPTSATERTTGLYLGSSTPRIHSKLVDLPSRGLELIDFAESIKLPLLPWQKWVAMESHKFKADGRWASPLVTVVVARQNGKTTLMKVRALAGLFLWHDGLQIGTAHRLTTSLETFRDLVNIIEENEHLARQVKRIRWAHGSEEIELKSEFGGGRYMVKAGGSAARGISKPETVFVDETRELKDESTWASLRYTMMAAKNPQLWTLSNAGDQHSIVLNGLRERGMSAAKGDDIAYYEWSSNYEKIDDTAAFWKGAAKANPALGHTIHIDNIRAVLNDPPDVVKTEVLCRWVATISAAIPAEEWNQCGEEGLELDPEKVTWLGVDVSPNRRDAALVAAQQIDDERFFVKLLHTWHNPINLDDKAIANDIAPYTKQYPVETVAYSKRTASAIAARLVPAGIPISDIDGALYGQACDELLGAITSKRLRHDPKQTELSKQILSAARLPFGDGGWTIGRRASQSTVCATVATALVTHYATRPPMDLDFMVG